MAAYATDFVEKTWPLNLSRGGPWQLFATRAKGACRSPFRPSGYIWDRCQEAGVDYRSYGEFIEQRQDGGRSWQGHACKRSKGISIPHFRSFDLDYPDVKRTVRFVEELAAV